MAINNRSLDASLQQEVIQLDFGLVATGTALPIGVVPYPSALKAIRVAAFGLSGAPTYAFSVERFIAGAGATTITGGATTLTSQAYGTSGIQSMVLAAEGSTVLNLMAGDVLTITSGGANTAALRLSVAAVIQNTQELRSNFGL